MTDIVQIDSHGPQFKLRSPHSPESLKAGATRAAKTKPWLCRRKMHSMQIVGDVYVPETSLYSMVFALIASSDTDALVQCTRCGAVRCRRRP